MLTPLFALLLSTTVHTAPLTDCDDHRMRGTSIHGDTDDEHSIITLTHSDNDRCESATIIGKLTYTPDEDDVASIPAGGSAIFHERTSYSNRTLSLTRSGDGQILRAYQGNGHSAEYDADARRWLGAFLPRVLMMSGINVAPRVARWRAKGGVDNVLHNIESIESSQIWHESRL